MHHGRADAHRSSPGAQEVNLRIARTSDPALIRKMLTHPKVFRWLFEDGADPEDFSPAISPLIWYLVAMVDGKPVGMFVFEPRTSVQYLVTLAIWPDRWPLAVPAFKLAIQYAFDNIGAESIIGEIPADNPHAPRLAKNAGFSVYGLARKAFRRRGELQDVRILGVSKDTWRPDERAQDQFCTLCGRERRRNPQPQRENSRDVGNGEANAQWQSVH